MLGAKCKAIVKVSIWNLEKAMLRNLAQGNTLPQVACSFGLSLGEAKSYRDRIFSKLGLHRPVIREYGQAVGLATPRRKLR
jgi:DNA-binding NarL/FixJ family response regulator